MSEWLLPLMHLHKHKAGHALFRRGDEAYEIFYVASGRLKLEGVDHYIDTGEWSARLPYSPPRRRALTQ